MRKKIDNQIYVVGVFGIIFLFAFIFYIWTPWDPPQAGVVFSLSPSEIQIISIKKFRYGGNMMCVACPSFRVKMNVSVDGNQICSNLHTEIGGLGSENMIFGVKCPKISEFTGKYIEITAAGYFDNELVSTIQKTLMVPSDLK